MNEEYFEAENKGFNFINQFYQMEDNLNEGKTDNLAMNTFECDCGKKLYGSDDIKFHQNICKKMQEKYSDIFCMFNNFIQNYKSKQEIKNIKSILNVFQDQLEDTFLKEENKQNEEDEKERFNPRQHKSLIINISNGQRNEVQLNIDDFQCNLEDDINSQEPTHLKNKLYPIPLFIKELSCDSIESPSSCDSPKISTPKFQGLNLYKFDSKKFQSENGKMDEILFTNCSYCKLKFTAKEKDNHKWVALQKARLEKKEICCPICKIKIEQAEIDQILNPETELQLIEFDKIKKKEEEQKQLEELLQGLDNVAKCKCGNMMLVEQGDIDLLQKDIFGQPISYCNQEPYHLGKTCEEFEKFKSSSKCRFCLEQLTCPSVSHMPAFQEVCRKVQCKEMMEKSCDKINEECKHPCCGFKDEVICLPCLKEDCVKKDPSKTLECNGNDYCTICYVEQLDTRHCIQLECKHIFHLDCMIQRVKLKWNGSINGINFNYLECPSCKQEMIKSDNQELHELITKSQEYREKVKQKVLQRAQIDKLEQDPLITEPQSIFYNNIQALAISRYQFFECFQCKDPFFGGVRDCAIQANQLQAPNPEEILCNFCTAVKLGSGKKICETHGVEFIEFKCKYCCDMSQWFCFGTTHFCHKCHDMAGSNVTKDCPGDEKCPLKGKHPPNGQEHALGCAVCRQLLLDSEKEEPRVNEEVYEIVERNEIPNDDELLHAVVLNEIKKEEDIFENIFYNSD
ncbi:e3 ubiquitin-protein ligase [Stylonychia lemnae]|uniref:E3 ubiquitin-protein ligase n=1 Tax=Stylonychia lemnae TaxID=5949 RepID=A0A078A3D1_STYLE|nr:e3 ubiquitin-protein ligase [Stylonychia lemnae]|eukprot:CDW75269.1 e3 ubiquitin-protein ligase [Stylonychia lemnae]